MALTLTTVLAHETLLLALSNEEAGEADPVGRIVAWLDRRAKIAEAESVARGTTGDTAGDLHWAAKSLALDQAARGVERGDWRSTPVPTVNGTDEPPSAEGNTKTWPVKIIDDEPPNAILAGVPEDAGRTDVEAADKALAEYDRDGGATLAEVKAELGLGSKNDSLHTKALREAGGREEHVERPT